MMHRFEVEYYDTDEGIEATFVDVGLVCANSWAEAVKKITDYYGEENLVNINFYELDDILFTKDIVDVLSDDFDED